MKVVKIIFGILAGVYCIAQVGGLLHVLIAEEGYQQLSSLFAVIGIALLAGVLSFALLRSAFRKPAAEAAPPPVPDNEPPA